MTFLPASINNYLDWLRGFTAAGGKITHYYDRDFASDEFVVAVDDFATWGELGAAAKRIIVPAGIRHRGGDRGHNRIYLLAGYEKRADVVPVYRDVDFLTIPGAVDAKRFQEAEDRKIVADAEHTHIDERLIRLEQAEERLERERVQLADDRAQFDMEVAAWRARHA